MFDVDTKTLKAGDTVYWISGGSYQQAFHGTVEKVTPSGQVNVNAGHGRIIRFTPQGREIGSSSRWYGAWLTTKERYDSFMEVHGRKIRARKASAAVQELAKRNFEAADKEELLIQALALIPLIEAI